MLWKNQFLGLCVFLKILIKAIGEDMKYLTEDVNYFNKDVPSVVSQNLEVVRMLKVGS